MDKKYLDGHACAQDPEGIVGCLYRVRYNNDQKEWLFIDEGSSDDEYIFWHFDSNKHLIESKKFQVTSNDPEDILHDACEWADIPDAAIEELEDSWLKLEDLTDEFSGI